MTEQQEVAIKELHISEEFQMRSGLDRKLIVRLADAYKAGEPIEPIKVAQVDGVSILVDGFHRVAAMESIGLGWWTTMANVQKTTRQGAFQMAARANLTPGKALTRKETRKAFKTFVKNGGHRDGKRKPPKSYRVIARELGVGHVTIRRWMKEDFPEVAAELGKYTVVAQTVGRSRGERLLT